MFDNILKWLQQTGQTLLTDLGLVVKEDVQVAVTDLDALVTKYTPIALAQVQAVASTDLSSAEKRSTAYTKIAEQLETDGQNIEADGFESFVNLLVETGVNLLKVLTGQSLAQATPPAAS